ncbi:tripartite tricarboxylate transporter permease [Oscillospiraceae bacterium 44-34]
MLSNIMLGLTTALSPINLIAILGGTVLGICFGAMPGLSATMGIAVLIPVSYGMEPATGLILLASVYVGATYGGSISAVLVNTPGTPSAAATGWDGHAMALKGHGTEALIESAVASFWGTFIGFVALLTIAPPLANFSLKFSSQENVCLAIFGLTIIASLSSKNILHGLIGGVVGLLLGCIGMDPQYGMARFTFGQMSLMTGFPTVPTLIGLYSISQLLSMVAKKNATMNMDNALSSMNKYRISLRDLIRKPLIYLVCGIEGVIIGIIPGAGGSVAAFMGYDQAKRMSKTPEEFGKGCRDGISGPESANNGVIGGALIPMMTLGIPGNAVTAVLMGALMLHGLTPGNDLFTVKANITYPFIFGLLFSAIVMGVIGVLGAAQFAKVNRIPQNFLASGILVLTVLGAFSCSNSYADVYIMLVCGVLGYILKFLKIDLSAVVLGYILGPIAEKGWVRTFIMNGNSVPNALMSIVQRPICIILIIMSIIFLALPFINRKRAAAK